MSFFDFMRRFLGLPNHVNPREDNLYEDFFDGQHRNDLWNHGEKPYYHDNDSDYIDENDEFRNVPSSPFGFKIFSGDPLDIHRYFEYQFNEMLKNFRAMEGPLFGSGLMEVPDFDSDTNPFPAIEGKPPDSSVRDKFLKPSYEQRRPGEQKDIDLDDKITKSDLKVLFPNESGVGLGHEVPQRVFGQSVVTKTVRLPGGRLEHHKTIHSADGSEQVTVTRQIGDQKYSVTTSTDKDGVTHRTEELVNLNEGELKDFENRWQKTDPVAKRDLQPFQPSFESHENQLLKIFERFFK